MANGVEGMLSDRSEPLGEGDGGEGGAVLEGLLSKRSDPLGEGDGGEGVAAAEGTRVNGCDPRKKNNVFVTCPLLPSFLPITRPSLALISSLPSYVAWSGSTGREGCASIFVTPHSEHTIAGGAEEGGTGRGKKGRQTRKSEFRCRNGTPPSRPHPALCRRWLGGREVRLDK